MAPKPLDLLLPLNKEPQLMTVAERRLLLHTAGMVVSLSGRLEMIAGGLKELSAHLSDLLDAARPGKSLRDAYDEGYADGQSNAGKDNPFRSEQPEFNAWARGKDAGYAFAHPPEDYNDENE